MDVIDVLVDVMDVETHGFGVSIISFLSIGQLRPNEPLEVFFFFFCFRTLEAN